MKKWLFIAALCGSVAVIVSALARHLPGLNAGSEANIGLGANYQLWHALAMGLAALAGRGRAKICASISALLFLAGILLFSGGLYLMSLTGNHGFAILVPLGGGAFIAGWIALAVTALKLEQS